MVNTIKDIANKLDGYSSDNQGFLIISFTINGTIIELSVKPYLKNENLDGVPEYKHLSEIIDRLLNYSLDAKESNYEVLKATKCDVESWELSIMEI